MEDIQGILEKINREGVEKAEAEAARIVAEAKAKADALVKAAREDAAKAKADAEKASADYAAHAAETIRQGARDILLGVAASVTTLLEGVLKKNVTAALADPATAGDLVKGVLGAFVTKGEIEIAAGAKLAETLKAELAAEAAAHPIKVVTDETLGAGFSVRIDGGRVESAFTADVIAAELARRLRPELAKIVAG